MIDFFEQPWDQPNRCNLQNGCGYSLSFISLKEIAINYTHLTTVEQFIKMGLGTGEVSSDWVVIVSANSPPSGDWLIKIANTAFKLAVSAKKRKTSTH